MANIISQGQISPYLIERQSFIPYLQPSDAVRLYTDNNLLGIIQRRLGNTAFDAFNPYKTVDSPLKNKEKDGQWLKRVNIVGINVRTIHNFWNVVKYTLTLSEAQSVVHLLPIWEPGVVASLYGMSTWNINPEFFSGELHQLMPHLDTVEKQLKVVINILHGMGKTVGMDVIPHTDRYSEQVLANPQNFEWLQRIDFEIVRHENNLHETVQELIFDFLKQRTPDTEGVEHPFEFSDAKVFFENTTEAERLKILFGEPHDYSGRLQKREELIQFLYDNHFESVPATMGPPYRGIKVDKNAEAVIDEKGREWRDYVITKPEKFSRVFGPLTRYKLYENKDNNADWAVDFTKPIPSVWDYVAQHYARVQEEFNFDFMRGDMAHVQMRAKGVPKKRDEYYDILGFIKNHIAQKVPYFGSFAETFLAPAGEMAYGDEVEHLEACEADSTLGDLQSMVVGSPRFLSEFRRYLDILYTKKVALSFTIMTADKDDPRFDEFYVKGNEARLFISLFLTDMPSYMGMGFEQRDTHLSPAPNEHYTKLYVFRIDEGEKATHGDYVWGSNKTLFNNLERIKLYAENILKIIQNSDSQWIIMPSLTDKVIAWTQKPPPRVVGAGSQYLFIVNLDIDTDLKNIEIPTNYTPNCENLRFDFSTVREADYGFNLNENNIVLNEIKAGEGRAYIL
jgi:hypothetical protein